jgi:hypothetical protein
MIPVKTPLKVSGVYGRNIDRQAINELQRIQGELGTGMRKAITVDPPSSGTYPEEVDSPNMYPIKWVQFKHPSGEYNEAGESSVEQDEMSGREVDAYVFNTASLDPLPVEAYIPKGTILDVTDHNTFVVTDYRSDQMRVKAKAAIDAYANDGCPVEGEAIVMHIVDTCEEEWKDDNNSDDDYKIKEVKIYNVGGPIAVDEIITVYQVSGRWYTSATSSMQWGITVSGGDAYPTDSQRPNMYRFKFIDFAQPAGNPNAVGESEIDYTELTTEDYDGYVYNVANSDSLPLEAYIPEKTVIEIHPHGEFYTTDYRSDQMRVRAVSGIAEYQDDGCPIEGQAIVMQSRLDCETEWKDDNDPDDDHKIGEITVRNVGQAIDEDEIFSVWQIAGKWYTKEKSPGAQIIRFQFNGPSSSSSGSESGSGSSSGEDMCDFDIPPLDEIIAEVLAPACNSPFPEEMDDDGNIVLSDPLELLKDRKPEDLWGRQGIAVKLKAGDGSPGGGGDCSQCWLAEADCNLVSDMASAGWTLIHQDISQSLCIWAKCGESQPSAPAGAFVRSSPGNPISVYPLVTFDESLFPSCCTGCDEPAETSSSSSAAGCEWVIVYIDFHRWVTVITDFLVEDNQIRIKKKNISVWDDCKLPDEIIVGADCPEPSSSSSASGV